MKYSYQVDVLGLEEVHELSGAWSVQDLLALLALIEYEDDDSIPENELKEMAAMALSDLELDEAIDKVLELRFGNRLNKGQRQNLIEEIRDERIWEEYSDIKYHKELFNSCSILYQAFPKEFSEPDIVKIKLKVTALNASSETNLKSPSASFITRLVNDGMDEHNIIFRLFDEQIASNSFSESEYIIWKWDLEMYSSEEHFSILTIYTSWNWVDELKGVKSFESAAFADGQSH